MSTPIEPQIGPDGFPFWEKDPDGVKNYQINWSDELGSDTIATSTWTVVDPGIVKGAESHTGALATVRLSVGIRGKNHRLTNHIVTVAGDEFDQTIVIRVRDE